MTDTKVNPPKNEKFDSDVTEDLEKNLALYKAEQLVKPYQLPTSTSKPKICLVGSEKDWIFMNKKTGIISGQNVVLARR